MSNYTTSAATVGCLASGNATAETAFGPSASARAVLGPITGASAGNLDGREMVLRASVLITGGTTTNWAPSIRLNSGGNTNLTTFTSDTAIVTPTAFAVNSVTRLFVVTARVNWDATSGRLNGCYSFNIDSAFTNWVTLTAGLTSGVAAASNIQFLLTGFFSATNAGNTALLKYFEMDVV